MDAILAGACGYLLKDASIQELMRGIRSAAVGESLISPHDRRQGAAAACARTTADAGGRRDDPRPSSPTARSRC